jgi:hypothetical protein
MEELNERLAIRDERRPRSNQFRRNAQARVFLNQMTHSRIQNYLPGQKLDHFRKPENRLSIFRSGLIEVLQSLKITTFTSEEVFVAIRANQRECLNYMMGVHPTMIPDHATTYTFDDVTSQLRTNDNKQVFEHMIRLHPRMFSEIVPRPILYAH